MPAEETKYNWVKDTIFSRPEEALSGWDQYKSFIEEKANEEGYINQTETYEFGEDQDVDQDVNAKVNSILDELMPTEGNGVRSWRINNGWNNTDKIRPLLFMLPMARSQDEPTLFLKNAWYRTGGAERPTMALALIAKVLNAIPYSDRQYKRFWGTLDALVSRYAGRSSA